MFSLFHRLLIVFAILCGGFLTPLASPAQAQTLVRKSINDFSAAELASLRRGMAVMISRNSAPRGSANYRRSWIYWANMHSHYGSDCKGAIPNAAGMEGVQLFKATTTDETLTWCQCEHGSDYFLPWHRMYMYFFERVLRQAANDPNLTLPYWDYQTDARLPAAYRAKTYVNDAGNTVANPLYIDGRNSSLNAGTAGVAASAASSTNAMGATDLSTFRSRLEATPHGTIHCALGVTGCKSGIMGIVPSSALDPIFTTHHTNIDRLYECWLQVSPSTRYPSDPAILNKVYYFPDADGKVTKRTVKAMLQASQLGYRYATGGGCPAASSSRVAASMASSLAAGNKTASGDIPLELGATSVPLGVESEAAAKGAAVSSSTSGGTTAPAVGSALVVIEGVSAEKVPGVLYNVYLANAKGDRQQVGMINFFGFEGTAEPMTGDMSKHKHGGADGMRFEFDATDAVAKLGLSSTKNPILIFEPTTGLTDSTVAKATPNIGADSKVTFKQAWLRVRQK